MTELASVEVNCQSDDTQSLSHEAVAELMAKVEVISRRLGEPRPARWMGAGIDVLNAWPAVPFTRVATMQAPGSSTFATALVYEKCPLPNPPAGQRATHPQGVQLLVKRARAFGADAIVVHTVVEPADGDRLQMRPNFAMT